MSLIEQPGAYQINWDPGKDITYEILIANLGGYEKAKHELKLKEQGSVLQCCAAVTADMIRYALLEYRRQHNIFEVGDWAFPLIKIIDEIEGVGRFICAEKGELVVIREIKNKGAYCSHEHRLDNSFYMAFSEFRHATDEEIKAGKRLDNEEEH